MNADSMLHISRILPAAMSSEFGDLVAARCSAFMKYGEGSPQHESACAAVETFIERTGEVSRREQLV